MYTCICAPARFSATPGGAFQAMSVIDRPIKKTWASLIGTWQAPGRRHTYC